MFEKHLWKSDILSKDVTVPQVFFKHFETKTNKLPLDLRNPCYYKYTVAASGFHQIMQNFFYNLQGKPVLRDFWQL